LIQQAPALVDILTTPSGNKKAWDLGSQSMLYAYKIFKYFIDVWIKGECQFSYIGWTSLLATAVWQFFDLPIDL